MDVIRDSTEAPTIGGITFSHSKLGVGFTFVHFIMLHNLHLHHIYVYYFILKLF